MPIGPAYVRKHRAPKGALRRQTRLSLLENVEVRKHRAPKGALRHLNVAQHGFSFRPLSESTERQKVH